MVCINLIKTSTNAVCPLRSPAPDFPPSLILPICTLFVGGFRGGILQNPCKDHKHKSVCVGLGPEEAKLSPYIASMGIYVFKKSVLVDLLKNKYPTANDFGGEIIPWAAADGLKVKAFLHNDYWEDIGTIKSFFEANLALAAQARSPAGAALCNELL